MKTSIDTAGTTLRLSAAIGLRTRSQSLWNKDGSLALRRLQASDKLNGFEKTYAPLDDEGTKLDPQSQRVRDTSEEIFKNFRGLAQERWDTEANVDYGNASVTADVVVDGDVLIEAAPVPYLLFLEGQVEHTLAYLRKAVVLGDDQVWTRDPGSGMYRSETSTSQRNVKDVDYRTLSEAKVIDGHAFEAKHVKVDTTKLVGNWSHTALSGALSLIDRRELVAKGEKLLKAVRTAREEANATRVSKQNIAVTVLDWWLP
jgi:hypothetical protein